MATETAMPTTTSSIVNAQQYRDRYRPFQLDTVDDAIGGGGLAPTTNGTTTVSIANGGAVVQACRYDLTAGPQVFTPAANGGGSNRFDIVCLTYDASHTPVVYSRIVQGTAGAGLPALTNSLTGVWDFPIAHYEKTPAGTIVNLRDRRKFNDGNAGVLAADDTTGTSGLGWFPVAPRIGQRVTLWPSGTICRWNGTAWIPLESAVWNALSYNSGFNNHTFGYAAAWRWCGPNEIELRGIMGKAAGAVLLTLDVPITLPITPINIRPAQKQIHILGAESSSAGKNIRLDVDTSGTLTLVYNDAGYAPHWASLDNVKISLS